MGPCATMVTRITDLEELDMQNGVGKRIAMLRKQRGWSQLELAEKLNISDKAVSKWENGGMPGVEHFPNLSKIFNVTIDYLMLGDGVEGSDSIEKNESEFAQAQPMPEEEINDDFDLQGLRADDLELILLDQRDLYTEEELNEIQARYEELKLKEAEEGTTGAFDFEENDEEEARAEEEEAARAAEELMEWAIKRLPKNLKCPKCDGENEHPGQYCQYCGFDFVKDSLSQKETNIGAVQQPGCLMYFVALMFPIIGIIIGLLRYGEPYGKMLLKTTVKIIIWEIVLTVLIYFAFFAAGLELASGQMA